MKKNSFLTHLILFTIPIAAVLYFTQAKYDISQLIWAVLGYFVMLTLIVNFISQSGLKKDNKTFITRTYGAMGIRFLFSVFPLIIYLFFYRPIQKPFVICYLFLYFLYTAFEIYHIVLNLRLDSNKK